MRAFCLVTTDDHGVMPSPIAMFSARAAVAVAISVIVFSLISPPIFGALADEYIARLQRNFPPGSGTGSTLRALSDDGVRFAYRLSACGRKRPCYWIGALYAGGNPLCSSWRGFALLTSGLSESSAVERWIRVPAEMTCRWQRHPVGEGLGMGATIRAEVLESFRIVAGNRR
jgi:hypothetical protein